MPIDIVACRFFDITPNSLMDSIASPKVKITKGKGVRTRSLTCSTLRVEGPAKALG
jgi:hypothetical protein